MKNKIFITLCLMIVVCTNFVNLFAAEEEYYQSTYVEDKKVNEINGDYYDNLVHIRLFSEELDSKDRILKSRYEEILKDKVYLKIYKSISGDSYTVSSQAGSVTFSTEYLTKNMDLYIKNNKILADNLKRAVVNKCVTKLLFLEEEIKAYIEEQKLTDDSSGGPEFSTMLRLCQGLWLTIDREEDAGKLITSYGEIYYWNEPSNYDENKAAEEQVSNVVRRVKYIGLIKQIKETFNQYEEMKLLIDNAKNVEENTNINTNTGDSDVTATCDEGWWGCAFNFLEQGDANDLNIGNLSGLKSLEKMVFDIGNIIFILVTAFLGVKYIWGGVESKFSVKTSLVTLVVAAIVFYGWNAVTTIFNVKEILTVQSGGGYQNFAVTIYNTIMYIINVAAIGGIIYIGIKYLMAGADGKAEMKLKFIPVIMGIIMVYGALNVINFILDIVYTF